MSMKLVKDKKVTGYDVKWGGVSIPQLMMLV